MKPPFSKFIHPVDRNQFRLHILKVFCFQVVLITIAYIVLQNRDVEVTIFDNSFGNLYLAWMINFFMLAFVYDIDKFRGRFKDIYPDQELNKIFYFIVGFVPLLFFAMIAFFCYKKSDSDRMYPRGFKVRYAILAALPLIVLQGLSIKVAYNIASPTGYYMMNMLRETIIVEEFKRNPDVKGDIFDQYIAQHSSNLSTSEIVILLSRESSTHSKVNDRSIASEKELVENGFHVGVQFINSCHKAISLADQSKLEFFDYGPLQWLQPSGPFEIVLTTSMEYQLSRKASWQLHEKCRTLLDRLERSTEKLPVEKRQMYNREIASLKMKLDSKK